MLIIEKVFLLKNLELFNLIPEKDLIPIAEILEEKFCDAGTDIFNQGDPGDAMYIILEGSVRIHIEGVELAILSSGSYFGELSILDSDTRSATATALEPSTLLCLRQESFYEMMEKHFSISTSVIRTLCRRLRDQNEKAKSLQSQLKVKPSD